MNAAQSIETALDIGSRPATNDMDKTQLETAMEECRCIYGVSFQEVHCTRHTGAQRYFLCRISGLSACGAAFQHLRRVAPPYF